MQASFMSFCIPKPKDSTQKAASKGNAALEGVPPDFLKPAVEWS